MPNPFNALNPNNPLRGYDFNYIRNVYRSLNGRNPIEALNQIAMSNPNVGQAIQAINGGANPKQLFGRLCQQRGINPNEFINNIVGNNGQAPKL